jgi:thermitase
LKRISFAIITILLAVSFVFAGTSSVHALSLSSTPTDAQTDSSSQEIIVKFKPGISQATQSLIHTEMATRLLFHNNVLGFDVVKLNGQSIEKVLDAYRNNPLVEYAEPNIVFHAMMTPNDTYFSDQWSLKKVQAPTAWDLGQSADSVEIAVIDTGVDNTHPDLDGKVINGHDYVDNDNDPMDLNGHGTHVAGVAAAVTNNQQGIAGMAPKAKIYAVRVLDENGEGTLDKVASGIVDAADHGAKVINLSLGSSQSAQTLKDAIDYAWNKGAVVVAAAGNDGTSAPTYPAYYNQVLAVAATDNNDHKADFSNYGKWVDVAAPGVDITSTYVGGGYKTMSGTSMAAPHVSGLAALLAAKGLDNTQILGAIQSTAEDVTGTGSNWEYGRINALSAMQK